MIVEILDARDWVMGKMRSLMSCMLFFLSLLLWLLLLLLLVLIILSSLFKERIR